MSSQVNKSNVRFKPRVGRRTRLDSNARRNSTTISTSFSAPGDREALKALKSAVNESAIEDDDEFKAPSTAATSTAATPIMRSEKREPVPPMPLPPSVATLGSEGAAQEVTDKAAETGQKDGEDLGVDTESTPATSAGAPSSAVPSSAPTEPLQPKSGEKESKSGQETQADVQQQLPTPKATQTSQADASSAASPAVSHGTPLEAHAQPTPHPAAASSQPMQQPGFAPPQHQAPPAQLSHFMPYIPQPVQPVVQLVPVPTPGVIVNDQEENSLFVQDPVQETQVVAQEEEELSSGDEDEREIIYDADGNEVVEPRHLKKLGKFNAKVHFPAKKINEETFTMSALCTDIPFGDLNDDYYKYEEVRSSRKREKAQLLQAKRMIRGQYMPKSDQKRFELLRVYKKWQEEREHKYGHKRSAVDLDGEAFGGLEPAIQQPTLKLQKGADGKIIVDTKTQQVDRHSANRADEESGARTEVGAKYSEFLNSASFSTKERPERWSAAETDTFYNALSAWGTDFNLIAQFFPQRTRGQIKTKFKYEERRNPQKVQLYLIHKKKVRLEDVSRISGRKITNIEDIEADLEKVRKEHAEQLRKESEAKEAAAKEDAERKTEELNRRRQAKGLTGSIEIIGELPAKGEDEDDDDMDD